MSPLPPSLCYGRQVGVLRPGLLLLVFSIIMSALRALSDVPKGLPAFNHSERNDVVRLSRLPLYWIFKVQYKVLRQSYRRRTNAEAIPPAPVSHIYSSTSHPPITSPTVSESSCHPDSSSDAGDRRRWFCVRWIRGSFRRYDGQ